MSTIGTITKVVDAATVATTKYTVGTAVNTKGKKYVRVTVKSDKVFTLYGWGHTDPFSSAGGNAPTTGCAIPSNTSTACPATAADGSIYYMRCAGNYYFLPLVYQASGGNATITVTAEPFD